jgi:hypothetical protein
MYMKDKKRPTPPKPPRPKDKMQKGYGKAGSMDRVKDARMNAMMKKLGK